MNTRFDNNFWITARGEVISVNELETDHAMNILRMFVTKPTRTMAMILTDIENSACYGGVWAVNASNARAQSIRNVTSLSTAELKEYALNSNLGRALASELERRGVNIVNILNLYAAEASTIKE